MKTNITKQGKTAAKKPGTREIPPMQVALDLVDLPRAIQIAEEAVKGILAETGNDITKAWVEAGTPLIKSEGMNAVRELRKKFPGHTIVADMKTMDAGAAEIEMAAKAGANVIFILGVSPDSCISEAVLAAKKYGVKVGADLISCEDPARRAIELEKMGVDIINIHVGLDQQVLGIKPIDINYVNAHGSSTPLNDVIESKSIKKVFGDHASRIMVNSTKSMIGHPLGGAGPLELIGTVLSVQEHFIHPTINYEHPDPDCDLDYVPNIGRKTEIDFALSNSFGFGGKNTVLAVAEISDNGKKS